MQFLLQITPDQQLAPGLEQCAATWHGAAQAAAVRYVPWRYLEAQHAGCELVLIHQKFLPAAAPAPATVGQLTAESVTLAPGVYPANSETMASLSMCNIGMVCGPNCL